ncbi:MAG TPA: farnesyl diphosphate synthase [Gemmatimonadota bacterium]|nr:farnesyl diphosphate synthase [Gemmatimonadota bacterium]
MTAELETFFAAERPRIEAALERAIAPLGPPLGEAARYAVHTGGKRVRPLLTLAAYREAGGQGAAAIYPIAAAVELVHTYSLLHDDLPCMDDDRLRRGQPTTHRVHGVPAATAAGGALQQLAFLALGEATAAESRLEPVLPELLRRLARAAGVEGMVGGQFLDLEAEGRAPDAAGLEAIHRGKTAALISSACTLGALAAGAPRPVVAVLASYGTNLGLAFQIVDDLLDVTGDPGRTGKSAGADRARAKATYPAVHGLDGARRQAQAAGEAARADLARLSRPALLLDAFIAFVLERMH